MTKTIMQCTHGIIPFMFVCWANPFVHLFLLKSSMPRWIHLNLAARLKRSFFTGQTRSLFVYFRSVHWANISHIWLQSDKSIDGDSNPERQDGRLRRIHWTLAASPNPIAFRLKFHSVIGSPPKIPDNVVTLKESFTYVEDVVQVR